MTKNLGALVLAAFVAETSAHSWGPGQCIPPMHGHRGRVLTKPQGVNLYIVGDSSIEITSEQPIRGFLLAGDGLIFSDAPVDSSISGICGGPFSALSHTSAVERNSIKVNFECLPGKEAASLRAYIVFRRDLNAVEISGMVRCPELDVIQSTPEPEVTTIA